MLWVILGLCAFNTFLLIAIAGSVAKLVAYMRDETSAPVEASRQESQLLDLPEGPLYRMENGELVQVGSPTYDQAVFMGQEEPYSDGLVNRPAVKNWDGIPVSPDDE